jgi:L-2-aminoadipate reductase
VLSTLDCIRLCATGNPKRLTFISLISTVDVEYYVQVSREVEAGVLGTDDPEGSCKGLGTGYGESK